MGDNCEACRTNTDPRAVPVHPNCNCEVITQNVQTGVTSEAWQPVEQWIRENGQLRFVQGNIGRPAAATEAGEAIVPLADTGDDLLDLTLEAIAFEPGTVTVLDLEEARWGDLERWLEQVGPLLEAGDHIVGIVSDVDETVAAVDAVATGAEFLSEVFGRRIFIGLLKVGLG